LHISRLFGPLILMTAIAPLPEVAGAQIVSPVLSMVWLVFQANV